MKHMGKLDGKIALITGSAAGTGEGIAHLFAAAGAAVVVSDLDREAGEAVAGDILKQGGIAIFHAADVREEADCRALMNRTVEVYGGIDVLVNNAGISTRGETTSVEVWDDILATNVRGPFICIQHAVRHPGEHRMKIAECKGEEWVEQAVRTRPFGRLLTPNDIALAALYFASDDSQCVTGTVMDLEQYPVGAPPDW